MKNPRLPTAVLMGLVVLLALPVAGCKEAPKKKVRTIFVKETAEDGMIAVVLYEILESDRD